MTFLGNWLESDFLFIYLKDNIIGLLLTLLAINTATSGLIASKIQDILTEFKELDFSGTIKEMKLSLLEQIILICISVVSLLVLDSGKISFEYLNEVGNVVLTTVLIFAIAILWDTGKAVFIIIENIHNLKSLNNGKK